MELSIVTSMYQSAPYLEEFYSRMRTSAQKIANEFEIIFVNDGSPDDSLKIALKLFQNDEKVKVIDLSRNFGQHKAAMTGLFYTKGEKIFLINCDLEENPENIEEFFRKFNEEADCDVVYGVQKARKGSFLSRILARIFYFLLNLITNDRLDNKKVFPRLMSKRYVKSLLEHKERELFMSGLCYITGYKQIPVSIETTFKGKSSYTIRKKVKLAVNGITSFSNKPLIYMSYLGMILSLISGIYIIYLVYKKIYFNISLRGWTSLFVSIWFIGGLILLSIGIIGVYLSKIFIETKNRPYTIVKDIFEHNKDK